MDKTDQARQILREPLGWIELDLDFCLEKWQQESTYIINDLVEHREGDGHRGWSSCCIHGLSSKKTGHWSQYRDAEPGIKEYTWTEIANKVPTITRFWQSFPTENFARIRFMQLAPGGWIAPHSDSPNGVKNTDFDMMDHIVPINIAIIHPDNCEMTLENYGKVPWKNGKSFIINITDTHKVVNNSKQPRLHMIAHCIIGDRKKEFSDLVVNGYRKQYDSII